MKVSLKFLALDTQHKEAKESLSSSSSSVSSIEDEKEDNEQRSLHNSILKIRERRSTMLLTDRKSIIKGILKNSTKIQDKNIEKNKHKSDSLNQTPRESTPECQNVSKDDSSKEE